MRYEIEWKLYVYCLRMAEITYRVVLLLLIDWVTNSAEYIIFYLVLQTILWCTVRLIRDDGKPMFQRYCIALFNTVCVDVDIHLGAALFTNSLKVVEIAAFL